MRLRLFSAVFCTGLFAAYIVPQEAAAAPITFEFTGSVDLVNSNLAPTFSSGQSISGSYTFESATPNQASTVGSYPALTSFEIDVGGYVATSTSGKISVFNDFGINGTDSYQVSTRPLSGSGDPDTLSGADVNGLSLFSVTMVLQSSTGTALNNFDLPVTPPNLADFDQVFVNLGFNLIPNGLATVRLSLDSLTLANVSQPVPAPSMMLVGLMLVATLRKKAAA